MAEESQDTSLRPEILQALVAGTAAATGTGFFDELVRHLARALETRCAWVTEWVADERRLNALAFWAGGDFVRGFSYLVDGTPCELVVDQRRLVHVPDRVVELFARDESLRELGAVSYLGIPLLDVDGELLGHLGVLHDRPLEADERIVALFNVFAGRAGAELRRLRRDRELEERERKLARLFDTAMDAVLELDADFRVRRVNPAAAEMFGRAETELVGSSAETLFSAEARGKLSYLAAELARRATPGSAWIPGGLEARRAAGESFGAEGTLSRFEVGGRPVHSLILRDVDARRAAEERVRALTSEAAYLREELDALGGFEEIVGTSPALLSLLADVERVAAGDTTVLLAGETGTGKELIARAIHRRSPRAPRPLVTVNCAAIAATLQESELFGHERGAFTGATQRREGRFKLADRGTIFLDEIGETPLDLQAKLLRVLQEGELQPVGSSRTEKVDVRIIAATNRDLERMAAEGRFRSDLLYRLNVFPMIVPPLRERGDDVMLLAEAFLARLSRRRGLSTPVLSAAARERLRSYDWPGNVRELQNVIERALITTRPGEPLALERALPDPSLAPPDEPAPQPAGAILTARELAELERANLARALEAAGGKISGQGGAAELLGLHPNTLASRMKALGLRRRSAHGAS